MGLETIQGEINQISKFLSRIFDDNYFLVQVKKNIRDVEYIEMNDIIGLYNYNEKKIYFNTLKNLSETSKIHEILHAISYRSETSRGFRRINLEKNKLEGIGLDEAITELLAIAISKTENNDIYVLEKSILKLFSRTIGLKYFICDYFYGTNSVETTVKKKYGDDTYILYKEISELLDNITSLRLLDGKLDKDDKKNSNEIFEMQTIYSNLLLEASKLYAEVCKIKGNNKSKDSDENFMEI